MPAATQRGGPRSGTMNVPCTPTNHNARVVVVTATVGLSADKFARELVSLLDSEGYRVHLAANPDREYTELVMKVDAQPLPIPMSRPTRPLADLVALIRWVTTLHRLRPQAVIAMTPKASLLSMIAARLTGVPIRGYFLLGLRLEGARGVNAIVLFLAERVTSACATKILANSPSLRAKYRRLHLAPTRKLAATRPGSSHGVDTNHFRPLARQSRFLDESGLHRHLPTIGLVGRLTADKGIHHLAAALDRVYAETPLQLLVVGPDDEADSRELRKLLSEMPFPTAVTGYTDDVRGWLSVIDIHVLPTKREGFPNAILEAAAMEIPSVTTRVTGAVDAVVHGVTGLTVPYGDTAALATAIAKLLQDGEYRRRLGAQARTWVVRKFQPEAITRSVKEEFFDA